MKVDVTEEESWLIRKSLSTRIEQIKRSEDIKEYPKIWNDKIKELEELSEKFVLVSCENCGDPQIIIRNEEGNFCSGACYRTFLVEKDLLKK